MKTKLIIGTRGSALALWQARHVASAIETHHNHLTVNLEIIKTQGDKILDAPLSVIGGKGLFTKEIEEALLAGIVDLAVHSMKDLPTEVPAGLHVAAVLKREDPRDVFVSRDNRTLDELPSGSKVGTSSLRRRAFILSRNESLDVVSIRGNVDTRLRKIESENLSGVMLAAAGMKRMGFFDRITSFIEPDRMIPAIGQGALAIETRKDDGPVNEIIAFLNDEETADCVHVERAFLSRMGGGCQVPMAAHCTRSDQGIEVVAAVVHPDGKPMVSLSMKGERGDYRLGIGLADELIRMGADEILRAVIGHSWAPGPNDYKA